MRKAHQKSSIMYSSDYLSATEDIVTNVLRGPADVI